MGNDLTGRTGSTALSTDLASRFIAGIAESRATTTIEVGGGKPLLRMLKTGEWVYGQANDEVQDGSAWAVNIMTLSHGWVCWTKHDKGKNQKLGEVMASVLEPKPPRPDPIDGNAYKEQRGFDLKCMDGEDEGVEVAHKMTSMGGIRGIDGLLAAIQKQLRSDPAHPCPVVVLETESYVGSYGKTYNPIYRVVDWVDLQGEPASAALPDPEPVETPPVKVEAILRKPKLAAAPPPPPPPVATAQLHTGQRRRPVAR
jgi:hypothetical protein